MFAFSLVRGALLVAKTAAFAAKKKREVQKHGCQSYVMAYIEYLVQYTNPSVAGVKTDAAVPQLILRGPGR